MNMFSKADKKARAGPREHRAYGGRALLMSDGALSLSPGVKFLANVGPTRIGLLDCCQPWRAGVYINHQISLLLEFRTFKRGLVCTGIAW